MTLQNLLCTVFLILIVSDNPVGLLLPGSNALVFLGLHREYPQMFHIDLAVPVQPLLPVIQALFKLSFGSNDPMCFRMFLCYNYLQHDYDDILLDISILPGG